MKIENMKTADLIPYARNSRTHSDDQVAQIIASIREFGFTNPVLIDEANMIIAGHGRLMAAARMNLVKVPCVRLVGLSDAQKRAYVIADNKLALNAGWDEEALASELAWLQSEDFDMLLTGFDTSELAPLLAEFEATTDGQTEANHVPQVAKEEISRTGDVWLLGKHRVMCGDSTNGDDIARLMDGSKAQMLHAYPPYGMGKEGDGVANDNLYREKLDAFQMDWWAGFRPFIEDNASAYIWGNAPDLWRLWYVGGLNASERMTFRSQIIWDKPPSASAWGSPIGSEAMRSYPHGYEVCMFFMLGEQGFNNNSDNYWEGWDPIRSYLSDEMKKCGWSTADLNRITGTQMAGHWVTKSQWCLITAENYEKIQNAARDHGAFKRDWYATRAWFDNTHDNMTDVWQFQRVTGEERHGHATPKPVEMMERVMRSSLPAGGICAEPFGGSGSTLIGAERTGRICYSMEMQAQYVDVIVRRWQEYTGKRAVHAESGMEFNDLEKVEA